MPWRSGRAGRQLMLAAVALVSFVVSAIWIWLQAPRYRALAVAVPVGGQRAGLSLPGVGSLFGGSFGGGSSEFAATQDVVAYLLRSRSVLIAVAGRQIGSRTVAEALTEETLTPENEESVLRELRKRLRVTQDQETGFVTVQAELPDSAVARLIVSQALTETGRVFRKVAQSQAAELVRAQESRLDSANSTLRQAEDRLLAFDLQNRVVPERSRLSQERTRLARRVDEAVQVEQLVQADRQSAVARQLEQSPAIAIVEGIPAVIPPRSKRLLFRSALFTLAVTATLGVGLTLADLIRQFRP